MKWRWRVLVLLMLVIPLFLVGDARAQSVDVTVGQTSIALSMNLSLKENLTALPLFNLQVTPTNDTSTYQQVLLPVNSAVQSKVSTASVSSLTLSARTINSGGMYTLLENYSIVVSGANVMKGSTVTSDLSFVQMNLSQPIPLAGLELNAVGSTYLLKPLNALVANYTTLAYFIDGSNPRNSVIPDEETLLFHLLQFRGVPEVSTWTSQNDILGQSTSWTLNPQAMYNLTMGLPTPEGPIIKSWVAIYNPSLSVTVPANAVINGNTVSFDVPASTELVMPVIAGVSVIALVATMLLDRRVSERFRAIRKKR
jgi:hypothetical protein